MCNGHSSSNSSDEGYANTVGCLHNKFTDLPRTNSNNRDTNALYKSGVIVHVTSPSKCESVIEEP